MLGCGLFFIALICLTQTPARAITDADPDYSVITMNNPPAVLTIAPGGYDSLVSPEDHLIEIFLHDTSGQPVQEPATDIWIRNIDFFPCPWSNGLCIADSSTYAPDPGHTTMSGMPRGGTLPGATCEEPTQFIVDYSVFAILELRFNSPELNADYTVGLADFAIFASYYQTDQACANYDESSDSPTVGLADFAIFAGVFGHSNCP